jgi:hypothetical protein
MLWVGAWIIAGRTLLDTLIGPLNYNIPDHAKPIIVEYLVGFWYLSDIAAHKTSEISSFLHTNLPYLLRFIAYYIVFFGIIAISAVAFDYNAARIRQDFREADKSRLTIRVGGRKWTCMPEFGFVLVGSDAGKIGIVYNDNSTRTLRITDERELFVHRKRLLYTALITIVLGLYLNMTVTYSDTHHQMLWGRAVISLGHIGLLIWATWTLVYRSGAQIIPGARVLDPDLSHKPTIPALQAPVGNQANETDSPL